MAFTYNFGANPPIDYPRMMVSDTQQFMPDGVTRAYVFEDSEILAFTAIQMGSAFLSGMSYSGSNGVSAPAVPVPYGYIAARMLDAMAANSSRLAGVTELLDVKLNPAMAAKSLRELAQSLRDTEDNSGSIAIIEQCTTVFGLRDRWFNQVLRMAAL